MTDSDAPPPQIWVPERAAPGASLSDAVSAYSLLLEIGYPDHHRSFQLRMGNDPDAAKAEAVVFSWLRSQAMVPTPFDTPGTGGPDYLCSPPLSAPFLIEVTSLNKEAVETRSGWPDELEEKAHSFGMVTANLWHKTRTKASQLSDYDVARVLAICLSHVGAGALLGQLAAQWLMTSQPQLSVPVGGPLNEIRQVSDLGKAAFLTIRDGLIVPARKSISAVLLIAIWEHELCVVGMLHPEPAVVLDYRVFGEVPFLRLTWPLKDDALRTEWVVGKPLAKGFNHTAESPTDEELRGHYPASECLTKYSSSPAAPALRRSR